MSRQISGVMQRENKTQNRRTKTVCILCCRERQNGVLNVVSYVHKRFTLERTLKYYLMRLAMCQDKNKKDSVLRDNVVYYLRCYFGAWLSLVERCVRDAEVAGSNPVAPTPQHISLYAAWYAIGTIISKNLKGLKQLQEEL